MTCDDWFVGLMALMQGVFLLWAFAMLGHWFVLTGAILCLVLW
jgi:hypothetical protein